MLIIRPGKVEDLRDIMDMVRYAGFGLTSLPKDRDLIEERIAQSSAAFSKKRDPSKETSYFFVLEDREAGRVVGTAAITESVGVGEPFYAYQIRPHVHESPSLGLKKEIPCLHLLTTKGGPCEIGALFVHPDYRKHGHGRLLSLSRFLFVADHLNRFPSEVIAEIRGISDDQGRSPFWEAVGRPFFDMTFPRADYLSAKDKSFIPQLLPDYPICIPLLPEEARVALGKAHEKTKPALKLLKDEGFEDTDMIDIFDGGPMIKCRIEDVRTIKKSRVLPLSSPCEPKGHDRPWMIAKGRLGAFRAGIAQAIEVGTEGLCLPSSVVDALEMTLGEPVRFVPLRPERTEENGQ
jgi:arginine N-succinyltransferase